MHDFILSSNGFGSISRGSILKAGQGLLITAVSHAPSSQEPLPLQFKHCKQVTQIIAHTENKFGRVFTLGVHHNGNGFG